MVAEYPEQPRGTTPIPGDMLPLVRATLTEMSFVVAGESIRRQRIELGRDAGPESVRAQCENLVRVAFRQNGVPYDCLSWEDLADEVERFASVFAARGATAEDVAAWRADIDRLLAGRVSDHRTR